MRGRGEGRGGRRGEEEGILQPLALPSEYPQVKCVTGISLRDYHDLQWADQNYSPMSDSKYNKCFRSFPSVPLIQGNIAEQVKSHQKIKQNKTNKMILSNGFI